MDATTAAIDLPVLLGIALGLGMDAFAVAISVGLASDHMQPRRVLRLAWHFGFFQFMMPVIGWLAGRTVAGWLQAIGSWIAFGMLAFVGGRMIYEALAEEKDAAKSDSDPTRGMTLIVLSVATSIDALAVGISFAMLKAAIWYPAIVIGVVAFLMTATGMLFGRRFGARFGTRMEVAGGLLLIGIGIKIVAGYLWR